MLYMEMMESAIVMEIIISQVMNLIKNWRKID